MKSTTFTVTAVTTLLLACLATPLGTNVQADDEAGDSGKAKRPASGSIRPIIEFYRAWFRRDDLDRKGYVVMRKLHDDFVELRKKDAGPKEWRAFRNRVREQTKDFAEHWSETADAGHPEKQHLLWATKDYFPAMIHQPPAEDAEEKFLEHLEKARRVIEKRDGRPLRVDEDDEKDPGQPEGGDRREASSPQ